MEKLGNDFFYHFSGKGGKPILKIASKLWIDKKFPLYHDFVAKNRYKWFGKTELCQMPSKQLKMQFIHDLDVTS